MSRSMLLVESEAGATLHDALAFIDAFEGESTSSNSSGGDADVSSGESTAKSKAGPAKKKKRSHTERVKTELERLRTDAEALENTLKRLKQKSFEMKLLAADSSPLQLDSHSNSSSLVAGRKDPRMVRWMTIVMEECRRRRESEALNRRLRAMLAKQVSMVQTSESALSLKYSDAEFNALYGTGSQSAVAKSLSSRVHKLQANVDSIFKRTGLVHVDSFLCWSQRKHDDVLGVFFESTFCLPVAFSMEQTRNAFSSQTPCMRGRGVEPMEEFDAYLHNSIKVDYEQQTFDLTITASLRTQVEDDRAVYVWTARASLPSKDWTFMEDSIVVVRRANRSSPASLLQNWHRVWMEEGGAASSVSDPVKESILSSLSNRGRDRVREFKQSMEARTSSDSSKAVG